MSGALTAEGLAVQRGGVPVLEGVDLSVKPGEALVLRGPNGIGKTSLLRTLALIEPQLAGRLDGAVDRVSLSGHADAIKPALSVMENLSFWAGIHGTRDIDRALKAFQIADLSRRPAQSLSAGQKRRLGLARMLVTGRPIWLMDEPTVSLDKDAVALFAEVVRGHLAQGGLAVIATHVHLGLVARELDLTPFRARAPEVESFLLIALFRRDLMLAVRAGGGFGLALAFFLIVAVLVAFGVGPRAELLSRIAPGVLWVGALLACLLSLDRLFQTDWEDGSLDALATAPIPLTGVVLAKAASHWVTTGLPLTLLSPVLGLMLSLPPLGYGWLLASLFIGTPALSMIGAFGAALTVGVKRGGLLLSLLVLPLYVPTLIFGAEVARRGADGMEVSTPLMLLGGITAGACALLPLAGAAALRVNLR